MVEKYLIDWGLMYMIDSHRTSTLRVAGLVLALSGQSQKDKVTVSGSDVL